MLLPQTHRKLAKTLEMHKTKSHLEKPFVANLIMNDVDELTERMAGWENDWRQLDAGQACNRIDVIAGQHTVVQHVRLSHSVHQQGKTPDQLMTFGFPDKPSEMMWNGRAVACPAMFDFNDANGYDAVSGKGFRGVTVSVPTEILLRVAEGLNIPVSHLKGNNPPRLLSTNKQALGDFRRYLYGLCADLPHTKTARGRFQAVAELDVDLPVRLLTALAASGSEFSEQPLKVRQRGMRLAIEFLEENCQDNPRIPEICATTGLSWRSLDRAFQEYFGIGPKRYLLNLRLINARRSLKIARPNRKIVDIANNWGFWHMGDFAREYRNLFSELPVETLRQQKQ